MSYEFRTGTGSTWIDHFGQDVRAQDEALDETVYDPVRGICGWSARAIFMPDGISAPGGVTGTDWYRLKKVA